MIRKDMHRYSRAQKYKAYNLFFGTLISSIRLRIINELRKKPLKVSELINILKISQTSISHNLNRMRKCGFVSVEQKGKFRLYKINNKTIEPLMKIIDSHMSNFCLKIVKGGEKNE